MLFLLQVKGESKCPNSDELAALCSCSSANLCCLGRRRRKVFEGALAHSPRNMKVCLSTSPCLASGVANQALTPGFFPASACYASKGVWRRYSMSREVLQLPGSSRQRAKLCAHPVSAMGSRLRPAARQHGSLRRLQRQAEQSNRNKEHF